MLPHSNGFILSNLVKVSISFWILLNIVNCIAISIDVTSTEPSSAAVAAAVAANVSYPDKNEFSIGNKTNVQTLAISKKTQNNRPNTSIHDDLALSTSFNGGVLSVVHSTFNRIDEHQLNLSSVKSVKKIDTHTPYRTTTTKVISTSFGQNTIRATQKDSSSKLKLNEIKQNDADYVNTYITSNNNNVYDNKTIDDELPQADASAADLSTTGSPEYPPRTDAVYFIVAVTGGAKVWSRTLTRTLVDLGPPFNSVLGPPLRPLYIDLPSNGR